MNARIFPFAFTLMLTALAFTLTASAHAQTESVIHNFAPGWAGNYPDGTLVLDPAGNMYGITEFGGKCCGTVYRLSPKSGGGWTHSVLHGFGDDNLGGYPSPTLARDAAGNLYGATVNGGNMAKTCNGPGCGVIFELSPTSSGAWKETLLHVFSGGKDGGNPLGQLLLGADGNIYGVTEAGGNIHVCASKNSQGCGVVFQLSPLTAGGWKETVLYTFPSLALAAPSAGLVRDSSGNIYGTTILGGTDSGGVVYKLTPTASGEWTETTLYNFSNEGQPQAGLISDAAGNLYGTTINVSGSCPNSGNCGIAFELSPASGGAWSKTTLHTFTGTAHADGAYPMNLTFDGSGNLYGVTLYGGATSANCDSTGCGTIFKLTPASGGVWNESLVHVFAGGTDGFENSIAGLTFDASGNIFSPTAAGGTGSGCDNGSCGLVLEITP